MPPIEPFRLLDLPREVRDDIYRRMLCDWPDAGVRHVSARGTGRFDLLRCEIEPNILLANKQIYQEAKQVLIKGNQFVHIHMVNRDKKAIQAFFDEVPVVAEGCRAVSRFRNLVVMTYSVDFPKDSRSQFANHELFELIILHRDLGHFCDDVVSLEIFSRAYAGQLKHHVTIHNPFENTLSPDFLNHKNQERLLAPFTERYHGLDHFKIEGNVQSDLAKAAIARIWKEPPLLYPQTFLQELLRRKELGNHSFRDGDNDGARKHWASARSMLFQARNRRAWPNFKKYGGKELTDRITEVGFQLQSNDAQTHLLDLRAACLQLEIYKVQSFSGSLEAKRKACHIRGRMDEMAGRLDYACSEASSVSTVLGTDWTPSNEQVAKLFYRRAQGLRLFGNNSQFALHMINHAVELLPGDPLIQSEAQQIRAWSSRGIAP